MPINSFGLMVALALFAAIYRLSYSFANNGINPLLAEKYVFYGGFTGLLGARLWYLAGSYSEWQGHFFSALTSSGGFTFYGGFLVAFLVLVLLARRDGIGVGRFVDTVGPALTLGYAIGRVGCQLSGDGDYGMPTLSFWGMSYATGVLPTPPGVRAFPTPLFESTISVLILPLLIRAETSAFWRVPYRRFGLYLVFISAERFFVEFLRINPRILFGLSEAQVVAIALFIFGLYLLLKNSISAPSRESTSGELTTG